MLDTSNRGRTEVSHPLSLGYQLKTTAAGVYSHRRVLSPPARMLAPSPMVPAHHAAMQHMHTAVPQQLPPSSLGQNSTQAMDSPIRPDHLAPWKLGSPVGNLLGSPLQGHLHVSPMAGAQNFSSSRPNSYIRPRFPDPPPCNPNSIQYTPVPRFPTDSSTPMRRRPLDSWPYSSPGEPLDVGYPRLPDSPETSPRVQGGFSWRAGPSCGYAAFRSKSPGRDVDDPFGLSDADPAPLPPPPPQSNRSRSTGRGRHPIHEASWQHVLEVMLGENRWDTIRFSGYDDLFHCACAFLRKHNLNPTLQARLVQRMQWMVTGGESSHSIDIVDLI